MGNTEIILISKENIGKKIWLRFFVKGILFNLLNFGTCILLERKCFSSICTLYIRKNKHYLKSNLSHYERVDKN